METGKIVNSILAATADVFGTMLNLDVAAVGEAVEPKGSDTIDGVLALVGFSGKWAGTGMVRCDTALACAFYAHLLKAPVATRRCHSGRARYRRRDRQHDHRHCEERSRGRRPVQWEVLLPASHPLGRQVASVPVRPTAMLLC